MSIKRYVVGVRLAAVLCFAWLSYAHAGEAPMASPEVSNNIGPALIKAYNFVPIQPNAPNHLWLDEGNGRVQFMMFDKAVSDPALLAAAEKRRLEMDPTGGAEIEALAKEVMAASPNVVKRVEELLGGK